MIRALAALALASVVASTAVGCVHHQAVVPGVLDMRTDGKGSPRAKPTEQDGKLDPQVARTSIDAYIQGRGVTLNGSDLTVEDRHYWILGMVPIYNDDVAPELRAATRVSGALIEVEIGEEYSAYDVLSGIIARSVLPILAWVTPSWTFVARGRMVDTGRPRGAPAEDRERDEPVPLADPDAVPPPLGLVP